MKSIRFLARCLVALAVVAAPPAPGRAGHDCPGHPAPRMAQQRASYSLAHDAYRIPDVTLLNQDGAPVGLVGLLDSGRPVGLTFIFTTCTTICPVMTATFRNLQRELGEDAEGLRLIAISIDPEYDTPSVLKTYGEHHDFGDGWEFLTGSREQIVTVLKAFDAYYGDKMNHRPLYFFRRPDEDSWLRIEGLARGTDMAAEYRALIQGP